MNSLGKVFICGAGPGDVGLLTLRARDLLTSCNVILYDRLVGNDILDLASAKSEKIYVGREAGDPAVNQRLTNRLMIKYAREGRSVLRLKGGDPFIFGRGAEEAEYLASKKIKFEIVPGISSFIGASIYSGIPLTHRKYSSSLAIVTGHEFFGKHESTVKWKVLSKATDTLVILMGFKNMASIIGELIDNGMGSKTRVAIITNATLKNQKVVVGTLGNIITKSSDKNLRYPSIIIIGKVVEVRNRIKWFEELTRS
mgnify:CR=1 FL=1